MSYAHGTGPDWAPQQASIPPPPLKDRLPGTRPGTCVLASAWASALFTWPRRLANGSDPALLSGQLGSWTQYAFCRYMSVRFCKAVLRSENSTFGTAIPTEECQ